MVENILFVSNIAINNKFDLVNYLYSKERDQWKQINNNSHNHFVGVDFPFGINNLHFPPIIALGKFIAINFRKCICYMGIASNHLWLTIRPK